MISSYLALLRPKHWIKNLFLFAAPFFGGKLFHYETEAFFFPVFVSFSLCASSAYIINDIIDVENDKHHPGKKLRPIAAGDVSRVKAALFAGLLLAFSLLLSYEIGLLFFFFVAGYFILQAVYSLRLKHIAIVDIFCIAAGFVIRVLAGGAAFDVEVSRWLLVTMFMISLMLASGKRLGEVSLLAENIENHRKSMNAYSISALNEILTITSAAALIAYALYTVDQYQRLVYTIPVVTFGLFRYIMQSKQGKGDPTEVLMLDRWLSATVVLWIVLVGVIRYNWLW